MKNDNITIDDLIKNLSYLSNASIEEVKKAYNFASEAHEGQFRITKDPYISHPLNVALILTTIKADKDTLCAALLHDVIEDTNITKEDILNNFNETITKLVYGVTKINNINISTDNDYLTSYYKKIIVGMSEDVRVIIIKLADRLHNMRTLYALPIEKQKRKAKETLEILTPIAHRLGMNKIKSELEDLSLRYLKPDVYFTIVEKLNNTKIERENLVNQMMDDVSNLLKENDIKFEIKGRAKSIYSIYRKLDKGKSFNNIYDLFAMRIFVDDEATCYHVLGIIHSKYKPVPKRFKDYIAMPKTNLYQSLHTTVFGLNGQLFEIQIRTYEMDEVAENGVASHWAYKENKNAALEIQNITEQKLQFYKSIIELNNDKMSTNDFVQSVKSEVLKSNIYVYTPKGDVIELPKDATPIDFAYRVHSKIGDTMTGALVNDNIVPLNYKLNDGDIIKIITNKNSSGPNYEWLNIATTTSAKNKIKAFFNKNNKEEYLNLGKSLLEKELRRNKISIQEFYEKKNIEEILKNFKLKDLQDLYLNIGNSKFSAKSIIKKENADKKLQDEVDREIEIRKKTRKSDIIIGNESGIETHIANCCMPVPGDEIIGYITKSKGITIHRKICQNIEIDNEKVIEAKWDIDSKNKYLSEIIIYTNTNANLILDIVQAAINCNLQADNINIINKSENTIYSVIISVNKKEDIDNFIKSVLKIKKVINAERILK